MTFPSFEPAVVPAGGQAVPTLSARATMDAAIKAALENATATKFDRAWLTAVQQADGTVTTEIHGIAVYLHRGEPVECHHSFEVKNDGAIEQAFADILAENADAIVRAVLKDAALAHVMAENMTDLSEVQRDELKRVANLGVEA